MTQLFEEDSQRTPEAQSKPPESPAFKVVAFVKRQARPVRIGALTLCCLTAGVGIIFAYVSLFTSHLGQSLAKNSQPSHGSSVGTFAKSPVVSTSNAPTSPSPIATTEPMPVYPASILNLTNWKLTLPIGKPNNPDEIDQPQLASYLLSPYFQVDAAKDGVQFEAPVGGVTTSGSNFPRSELREMTNNGQQEASWSTTTGSSVMDVREAINHLPSVRPQLVAAQIHGPSAYVILVRLNGSDLFVEGSNGKDLGDLNTSYKLGTIYTLQITARSGHILVSYNGVQKVDESNNSSGDYFKAGCYTQSNPSYGDSASAYGQTTIYSLSVSHS